MLQVRFIVTMFPQCCLLVQYEENAEIQEYFKAQLDVMRQSATVFDLGAILIKPVQRILKYPLLLNELIKVRCDG